MKLWYVYVDWTLEDVPRPFYVGKGNQGRIRTTSVRSRNEVHHRITLKFGQKRTIVFESFNEEKAYEVEFFLVRYHQTFMHGGKNWWGANLDLGGRGGLGTPKSVQHREKIRQFMRTRKGSKNQFFGKRHTNETIEKIRNSMKGELGPCFGRVGAAHPMYGKQHSDDSKKKMSESHLGQPLSVEHIAAIKLAHVNRNQHKIKRNMLIVSMFNDGFSRKEIAHKLNLPINIVYGAIYRSKSNS